MGYSFDLQVDPGRCWPGQTPRPDLNPCCLLLLDQKESVLEQLVIAFVLYLRKDRATSLIEAMTRRHGDAEYGSVIVILNWYDLVHSF